MCVCYVDLCVNVVDLHIMKEHLNYRELWKTVTFHRILQGGSCKGVMVLCKTWEVVNGELKCVVFFFFLCILNLRGGVMNTGLCNLFWLRGFYVTKCNMGLGFFWKFNCSRFMWSKVIEKRRKANGLKRERSERSDALETSSFSLLVIA